VTSERLRRLREQKGLELDELERRSGVRRRLLELIDRGEFAELPTGLYGRSAIRGYAAALGLDADQVLRELSPALTTPEDPLDGLARVRGLSRRPRTAEEPPQGERRDRRTIQQLAPWRPAAALGIDVLLLSGICALLVWLTAIACGTTIAYTMRVAGPAIALLFALIVTQYFILLAGVRNATIGARIVNAVQPDSDARAVDVRTVLSRSVSYVMRQSADIVDSVFGGGERYLKALWVRRA
jgi:transcriptional regulator with XRE-family HTH domain